MTSPVFNAAAHVANQIILARQHIGKLEGALNGMQPLLSEDEHSEIERLLSMKEPVRLLAGDVVEVVEVPPASASSASAPAEPVAASPAAAPAPAPAADPVEAAVAAVGRNVKPRKQTKAKVAGKKPGRASRAGGPDLPSTGASFWLGLMGKRRHTLKELVDKAMTTLDVPAEAHDTLYNRLNSWLYPAVKAGTLVAAGDKAGLKAFKVVS